MNIENSHVFKSQSGPRCIEIDFYGIYVLESTWFPELYRDKISRFVGIFELVIG